MGVFRLRVNVSRVKSARVATVRLTRYDRAFSSRDPGRAAAVTSRRRRRQPTWPRFSILHGPGTCFFSSGEELHMMHTELIASVPELLPDRGARSA